MPIVPTGRYFTPSLISRAGQGAFEGALGGIDKIYAQDLARERLRAMRDARQFRTAENTAGLQEGLIPDPLNDLMAGGGGVAPRRSGGSGRYSTSRERSAGQPGPISRVDAEAAASYQHALAVPDRALREYQAAQSDYLGAGGPPPRASVRTERPDYEATPADMALALQRDASLEDEGTRRLRAALFEDQGGGGRVEITPTVNEYREGLSSMSDGMSRVAMETPEWSSGREAPEGIIPSRSEYRDEMGYPEGWSQDPISSFAKSLDDESVDPRSAPPALQAIEESIRTTKSPRDRKLLERAYGQLQRGVALDAKARRSGNYEAQMEAGTQIEQAMGLLDEDLISAMGLAKPEFGMDERFENLPDDEKEYQRRMRMYSELPISLEMTPGYEGIWNPSVDIGLASTTILDPSTLSAIGSLADDGNPMAKRMLGRLGAEPVSAKEAIKNGLVGDVVEYRSKLAAHINEEQQLLKGAGVDEDERAKAFLLGLIRIHGPDSFSVDSADDMAMARGAVDMHPSAQKTFLDQLFHAKAQGGKEELEMLKAETAGVTRRNVYTTAGGGRNEDVKLLGIEVDSLEALRKQRSLKKFQRSDVEFTPEKFPHLDDEIATLEGEIDSTETRIEKIRSRVYPGEGGGGGVPVATQAELDEWKASPAGRRVAALLDEDSDPPKASSKPKARKRSGRNQSLKPDMAKVANGFRVKTKGMTGMDLRSELQSLYEKFHEDPRWDDAAMREVEGVIESMLAEDRKATKIKWSVGGRVINP
tara:strand:+ start:626 stop:2911 length:2286 start_codon:yes stop_codon:yes gene_type:complete